MDADPLPLLLGGDVSDGVVRRPGRLEYHVSALQEILQDGCGGGGAEGSAGVCTTDRLDPEATDALPVKGPVDRGHNVLDLVPAEPEILEVLQVGCGAPCGGGSTYLPELVVLSFQLFPFVS